MSEAPAEVASFTIGRRRRLNPGGVLVSEPEAFARDSETLLRLYRAMTLTREFDARAVALQRTGRLGTYASSLGQEAIGAATADAMRPSDVLLPSFREHGAQLVRGVTPLELLLYWGGDERGSDFQGPRQDFPVSIPVGSHASHAAGVALAFQLRREPRVAVCIFGDGATSKGDVYEAMNFAGVRRLPIVFVVSNNGWAISTPVAGQTACGTLAQKAIACGFGAEQVDGNDAVAMRESAGLAIERARAGGGPFLIEALTYRLADHTTSDDARRYRSEAEVAERWKQEPIARLRAHLTVRELWDEGKERALLEEHRNHVNAAADSYLSTAAQPVEAMFDHLYAELPPALVGQRAEASGAADA